MQEKLIITASSSLYWEKSMPNNTVRYYHAEITRDLFDVVVLCAWGTKGTKRGCVKTHPFETIDDANVMIESIIKRRTQRGYTLKISKPR